MNDDIKGPWKAEHLTSWSRVVAYKAHEPHEGCTGNLVIVHVDGKPDIRKEISNLISAAPDLLEACKKLAEVIRDNFSIDGESWRAIKQYQPEVNQGLSAINKAEGKNDPELCPHGFGFVEYCEACTQKEIKAKWREKEDSHG